MIDTVFAALSAKKMVAGAALSAVVALSFTADDIETVLIALAALATAIFTGYQILLVSRINLVKAQMEAAREEAAAAIVARTEAAKTAADTKALAETAARDSAKAAELSQETLKKAESIDKSVDGHYSKIEERLVASEAQTREFAEAVKIITARLALADLAVAVGEAERVAADKATAAKVVTDLERELALRTPTTTLPQPAAPVAAPIGPLAAVTDAAKTIAEAVPQLDSIQTTGEATNGIVKEIKEAP